MTDITDRLEYLRSQIEAECISYGELSELQGLAPHIAPGDNLLLEWAGVPEFPEWTNEDSNAACAEGWDVFESSGSENGPWQICAIDDLDGWPEGKPQPFRNADGIGGDDDQVWLHVRAQIEAGNELHIKALNFVRKENPQEYFAIMRDRPRITFEQAWHQVAVAGRELGSGPAAAAERIAGGAASWLKRKSVPDVNAESIQIGVAVGLIMAQDPTALAVITRIHNEWRKA